MNQIKITTADRMLRELELIVFLFRLQLSNEYDNDPYLTIIDGKGERTNGRFMGRSFMLYSQTELFNIQGFKQEFTDRFETANNTTLIINQAKEIRDKASNILRYIKDKWNDDNYKVKEFIEWDNNRDIDDERYSADVLVFDNLSVNGVFYDRFMKLETIVGWQDKYVFRYLTHNQTLVSLCETVVTFLNKLIPSSRNSHILQESSIDMAWENQQNNSSPDFKQIKMNAAEYFKIEAIDDRKLESAILELLKVIEDLRPLRNSESKTYDYINIWLKSKYESTRIVTLSNGEKVEADINNPDLSMYYRYNNWLLGYFQYEYKHKTQATISFAYALRILTQNHNGQRGVSTRYELPNADKDDIIAAITNENSLELAPQKHNSIINTPDIDIFKSYFVANKNGWWDNLVTDIKANLKSGKGGYTIVAMAKVIYDSGKLHESMKPKKFAPWLRVFCETWGIAEIPTCKAGHTGVKDEITRMYNVFWYFNFTIPK